MRNKRKRTEGFTLVELVVVIAILAILAGIAVPAYSGYVTKAREASDLQVITTVNSAIDAATVHGDAGVKRAVYDGERVRVQFDGEGAARAEYDYELYMSKNSTEFAYYTQVTVDESGNVVGVR